MTKAILQSPMGPIAIEGDDRWLRSIQLIDDGTGATTLSGMVDVAPAPASPVADAIAQLTAYFEKEFSDFDLPLAPPATLRGQVLRDAIAAIPAGETLSYGALARIAGSAPRAIGQACARNPFPILIPCHRVVGSGGAIGHYSAGRGISTKIWLLDHERRGGLL